MAKFIGIPLVFAAGGAAGPAVFAAAAESATAPDGQPVQRAFAMFLLVMIVLGVLLLTVIVLLLLRRHRRRAPERTPVEPLADPWIESANRLQPYERRGPPATPPPSS